MTDRPRLSVVVVHVAIKNEKYERLLFHAHLRQRIYW